MCEFISADLLQLSIQSHTESNFHKGYSKHSLIMIPANFEVMNLFYPYKSSAIKCYIKISALQSTLWTSLAFPQTLNLMDNIHTISLLPSSFS